MPDINANTGRNEAVLDFMRARRSTPALQLGAPGPDEAQIREMVAIAARVPDHGKLAPWRFLHYTPQYCIELGRICETRALERNGDMIEDLRKAERQRFTRAPVVIGIISRAGQHVKIPEWEQLLSAGAAAQNLLIAANAFGFDAQWITEWVAYDAAMAPALGARPGEKIVGFLHVGTRTMPKTERDRPRLEDVYSVFGG
jgi:nitroreductase